MNPHESELAVSPESVICFAAHPGTETIGLAETCLYYATSGSFTVQMELRVIWPTLRPTAPTQEPDGTNRSRRSRPQALVIAFLPAFWRK